MVIPMLKIIKFSLPAWQGWLLQPRFSRASDRSALLLEITLLIQLTNTNSGFAGVNSSGATPVPIPNTEVKPACGDGIAGLTLWESSTMPAFYFLTRSGN
jgi:hypothetical protein